MSLNIATVQRHEFGEDRISMLWHLMCFVRGLRENPLLWKLTDPFLDAVAQFYALEDRNRLCTMTFLDVGVDSTSNVSRLVCEERSFPVDVIAA